MRRRTRVFIAVALVMLVVGGFVYGQRFGLMGVPAVVADAVELARLEEGLDLEVPEAMSALFAEERFARGSRLLQDGSEEQAYSMYRAIMSEDGVDGALKEKASFFAGSTAARYLERFDLAAVLLSSFLENYRQSEYADDALFLLGTVSLERKALGEAIAQFSRFLDEHPESPRLMEAQFMARECYAMLVEARAKGETGNYSRNISGNLLPDNLAALGAVLCALGFPLLALALSRRGGRIVPAPNLHLRGSRHRDPDPAGAQCLSQSEPGWTGL